MLIEHAEDAEAMGKLNSLEKLNLLGKLNSLRPTAGHPRG